MKPSSPLASLLTSDDSGRLAAVVERAQSYDPSKRFDNWLNQQDEQSLNPFLGGMNASSAQDFLYQNCQDTRVPIPDHIVSVALALIERWGWDVHRQRFSPHDDRYKLFVFEDETFLEWLVAHQGATDRPSSLPDPLQWPTTLEAFVEFDAEQRPPRNHEWLMALTVASGSNPWRMKRAQRRILAFAQCLHCGHPKIAVQLLALPGAPLLREILEKEFIYSNVKFSAAIFPGKDSPWRLNESYQRSIIPSIQAQPDFRLTLDEMKEASLELLSALRENGRITGEQTSELVAHWKSKICDPTFDLFGAKGLVERIALLGENPEQSLQPDVLSKNHAEMLCQILLDHGRTSLFTKSSVQEQVNQGAAWLSSRHEVSGPYAGRWSVFNSHAFNALMGCRDERFLAGCQALPLTDWLLDDLQKWSISRTYPELSALLDEDFGNGLSARGLLALLFLAQANYRMGTVHRNSESEKALDEFGWRLPPPDDLQNVATAMGILDWKAFFESHQVEAVEATEWIVQYTPPEDLEKVRRALRAVWSCCLFRLPGWMNEQAELLTRVLKTLSHGTCPTWKSDKGDQEAETWTFFLEDIDQRQDLNFDFHLLPHHLKLLKLEWRLACHFPESFELMAKWLEETPDPHRAIIERLHHWLEDWGGVGESRRSKKGYILGESTVSRLRAAVMLHRFTNTENDNPIPRF